MKLIKILLVCLAMMPINIQAKEVVYQTKNLEETLKEDNVEVDLSNYKETDDQITIYLFRGNGCGYCNNFLKFLASIVPEYGKYFKLESYEVWGNEDNAELMEKVGKFFGQDATGVPFIIIGEQVFPGYASQYDEGIKAAIVTLYNSEEKYDVFDAMEKAEAKAKRDAVIKKTISILYDLSLVALGAGIVIFYETKKNKEFDKKLNKLEKNIKELSKEDKKEVEKTTKNTDKDTKKQTKKTTKK